MAAPNPFATYDVTAYGARGDVTQGVAEGGIDAGATHLRVTHNRFSSADIGKTIIVAGAGVGGAEFRSTIVAAVESTRVALADAASTTVASANVQYGTNDTSAIQRAINDQQLYGGEVVIPDGIYFSDRLFGEPSANAVPLRPLRIRGANMMTSIIRARQNFNTNGILPASRTPVSFAQWFISDLTLDGNYVGQGGVLPQQGFNSGACSAFYVPNSVPSGQAVPPAGEYHHIERVRWYRASGYALQPSACVKLRDCLFEQDGQPEKALTVLSNITAASVTGSGPYTVSYTVSTPQTLAPGDIVNITNTTPASWALGVSVVASVTDTTHFAVSSVSDPSAGGSTPWSSGGTVNGPLHWDNISGGPNSDSFVEFCTWRNGGGNYLDYVDTSGTKIYRVHFIGNKSYNHQSGSVLGLGAESVIAFNSLDNVNAAGSIGYDSSTPITQKSKNVVIGNIVPNMKILTATAPALASVGDYVGGNLSIDQPAGVSAITVTASPFTYTAGPTPEAVYISGGTVSVVAKNGVTLCTSVPAANAPPLTLYLVPGESVVVTYSGAPTMRKDAK